MSVSDEAAERGLYSPSAIATVSPSLSTSAASRSSNILFPASPEDRSFSLSSEKKMKLHLQTTTAVPLEQQEQTASTCESQRTREGQSEAFLGPGDSDLRDHSHNNSHCHNNSHNNGHTNNSSHSRDREVQTSDKQSDDYSQLLLLASPPSDRILQKLLERHGQEREQQQTAREQREAGQRSVLLQSLDQLRQQWERVYEEIEQKLERHLVKVQVVETELARVKSEVGSIGLYM